LYYELGLLPDYDGEKIILETYGHFNHNRVKMSHQNKN